MSLDRDFVSARGVRWSFVFAGVGALLCVVGLSSARQTYRGWQVEQEIKGLEAQVQALEGRRLYLAETLARLQSPEALDKEARLRLGLQKPGERVFVVKGQGEVGFRAGRLEEQASEEAMPPVKKWWRYFFHPAW